MPCWSQKKEDWGYGFHLPYWINLGWYCMPVITTFGEWKQMRFKHDLQSVLRTAWDTGHPAKRLRDKEKRERLERRKRKETTK